MFFFSRILSLFFCSRPTFLLFLDVYPYMNKDPVYISITLKTKKNKIFEKRLFPLHIFGCELIF